MKKTFVASFALATALSISAQPFPKSKQEDTKGVMSEAYWKLWNPSVQSQIDKDIEANRKANAFLKLDDAAANSEIKVEQISHDFVFGAHIFNYNQLGKTEYNHKYKELYGTLFNSASVALYWRKFEMEPNRPRFAEEYWDTEHYWNSVTKPKEEPHWRRPSSDQIVDFLIEKGVRIHGHNIIWGNRSWQFPYWIYDFASPEEKTKLNKIATYKPDSIGKGYEGKGFEYEQMTAEQIATEFPVLTRELKRLFEKRFVELSKFYGNKIDSWDVVNESATDYQLGRMIPGSAICKSHYGIMPGDYTYEAFMNAQKYFPPTAALNINDYLNNKAYADQTKELMNRGCKIDILGSQMHLFQPKQCLDIAEGKEIQTPKQVWNQFKVLDQAGLPIHLSEITITSAGSDERGFQIQAIITQNLYRLWFSIKPMMGITWWNVVDDCGAPGEPTISGIFTRDMQPKPSFFALDNLINKEWKTNTTLKVDSNGTAKFRGFKGKYRVTYTDKTGETCVKEFALKQNGDGLN